MPGLVYKVARHNLVVHTGKGPEGGPLQAPWSTAAHTNFIPAVPVPEKQRRRRQSGTHIA